MRNMISANFAVSVQLSRDYKVTL